MTSVGFPVRHVACDINVRSMITCYDVVTRHALSARWSPLVHGVVLNDLKAVYHVFANRLQAAHACTSGCA